jgi:hypothetical protein
VKKGGSTHIDTAFMGLTSSRGVTVARTLSVRASSRPTHFPADPSVWTRSAVLECGEVGVGLVDGFRVGGLRNIGTKPALSPWRARERFDLEFGGGGAFGGRVDH